MSLPLEGVRVLDLTRALAGPYCTMILADLGANVIKVEPTPRGEMCRAWGPFDRGESVYYTSINRNKHSLAVDFRNPEGLGVLQRMARTVDVVVENFKPGATKSMGLDYGTLSQANPGLIYASITGFGSEGPYGQWPGFDQIAQGMSGMMSITG
ncbi:MAG: CaiB/BaiF CoA transferase family protein, partial [Hyphomicrobiaceae bacterium]